MLRDGRLGGRFRVRRRIGAGAFGEVFEAEDGTSGAVVALKRLARIDDGTLYRFKREFRAIAELRHENLVRMRELGVFDGDWYVVMEFVDGVDFLRWVRAAVPPTMSRATSTRTTTSTWDGSARRSPSSPLAFRPSTRRG